eukprot:TRINITY_DN6678_c0_g3_i2.p1 TRINITY_DN6678_c0_g3~~TRINITY_DN6678_c0_g3_i2.p1  ORF type:complete len:371 (-),score=29.38 TRINITY_DN6678_c0_g3_i2:1008-1976(-)
MGVSSQTVVFVLLFALYSCQTEKCTVLNNFNANGTIVDENQLGISGFNFVFTQQECCDLCWDHPDCNVYVQCLNEQGCPNQGVFGEVILFGECALKYQQKIADGLGLPEYWFQGPQTLFSSGYIPGKKSPKFDNQIDTDSRNNLVSCFGENCCGESGQVCCKNTETIEQTENTNKIIKNAQKSDNSTLYCKDNTTFCITLDGSQDRSECRRFLDGCGEIGEKCCDYAFTEVTTISNLNQLPLPCIAKDAYCKYSNDQVLWLVKNAFDDSQEDGICTLNDKQCGRLGNSCCTTDSFRGQRPREYCEDGFFCGFKNGQRICVNA